MSAPESTGRPAPRNASSEVRVRPGPAQTFTDLRRSTFLLDATSRDALAELARTRGVSKSGVVRAAIVAAIVVQSEAGTPESV